jgi:hypothetical protein
MEFWMRFKSNVAEIWLFDNVGVRANALLL